MFLWLTMALMTGAAVLSALCPLSRRVRAETDEANDVTFYADQMSEIDRDAARGALSPAEAVSARTEAGRRLLRARDGAPAAAAATGEPALRRRRAASALALSIVPIVGLAVYGALGSPRLASLPAPVAAAPDRTADLDGALAQIEAHLAAQPDDLRGWELVAPIYLRLGRFDDAARAYASALRIGGDTVDRLTGYGEALVSAANGVVAPEAAATFTRALALDPGSARARFYGGLAAEQDGNVAEARADYEAILRTAPPGAPWLPLVQGRLAGLTGDAPARTPLAADAVSPEIQAMVTSLDQRLRQSGGSEPEWSRLVRSYVVLGRREDALDRLRRARIALAGDPGAGDRLHRLATDLGLGDTEVAR